MKNWIITEARKLKQFYPPFGSLHFWAIQIIAIIIAAAQFVFKSGGYLSYPQGLYFIPVTLQVVPVIYAALTFGFAGSIGTAVWVVILSIPTIILGQTELELIGTVFQLAILVTLSIFMGQRVDREVKSRSKIEAYTAYILRAQEEERQHISRELHDETIQNLSLLVRQLDAIDSTGVELPPGPHGKLVEAQKIAEKAVADLRDFTRSLRPPILDDLGLVASIRSLLNDFSDRTKIAGQLKINGKERRFPSDIEVGLYRMAQEALWNVEHHARAKNVLVTINFYEHNFVLSIVDNGIGFNVPAMMENSAKATHLGLIGMQERAQIAGGKLDIQSAPGKGAAITFLIPR